MLGEKKKRKRKYWKSVGIIVGKVEKPIIIIKLNGIVKELIGDYDTGWKVGGILEIFTKSCKNYIVVLVYSIFLNIDLFKGNWICVGNRTNVNWYCWWRLIYVVTGIK